MYRDSAVKTIEGFNVSLLDKANGLNVLFLGTDGFSLGADVVSLESDDAAIGADDAVLEADVSLGTGGGGGASFCALTSR